jgi:thiamine pyrophosphate-dependent acetolactate synthase large subunit-like protein
MFGVRVAKPEELRTTSARAPPHQGSTLVKVIVHGKEPSMPPTISGEQASGFSLKALSHSAS